MTKSKRQADALRSEISDGEIPHDGKGGSETKEFKASKSSHGDALQVFGSNPFYPSIPDYIMDVGCAAASGFSSDGDTTHDLIIDVFWDTVWALLEAHSLPPVQSFEELSSLLSQLTPTSSGEPEKR